MDQFDVQILEPLTADRAFLRGVVPAGGFRVGRPEDHHLGMLHEILDGAVILRHTDPHGMAPMVQAAPIPAFPTVRIVMNFGMTNQIHEAEIGAQIVSDIAPRMMRAVTGCHGTGPVIALHPLNLGGDDVQRLVPTDSFIARDAAIFAIALAIGIEIDPFLRDTEYGPVNKRRISNWHHEAPATFGAAA